MTDAPITTPASPKTSIKPSGKKPRPELDRTSVQGRFAQFERQVMPTFFTGGLIAAPIGYYQLALGHDGSAILLFAYDADNFASHDVNGKNILLHPSDVFVVHGESATRPRNWVVPKLLSHQQALADVLREDYTLYQTSENTYQSSFISYALRESKTADQWQIFAYTNNLKDSQFVAIGSAREHWRDWLNPSRKLGVFSRTEAEAFINKDFSERLKRVTAGRDPLKPEEIGKPWHLRWWGHGLIRTGQRCTDLVAAMLREVIKPFKRRGWWKPTRWLGTFSNLAQAVLRYVVLGPVAALFTVIVQPLLPALTTYVKNAFGAREYNAESELYIKPPRNKSRLNDLLHAPSKAVAKLDLQNLAEGGFRPWDVVGVDGLADRNPSEWAFGALNGPQGSIVRLGENWLSVQHSTGVAIDYLEKERTAFARFNRALRQADAPPLPIESTEILQAGKIAVLKFKNNRGIEQSFITEQQFIEQLQAMDIDIGEQCLPAQTPEGMELASIATKAVLRKEAQPVPKRSLLSRIFPAKKAAAGAAAPTA